MTTNNDATRSLDKLQIDVETFLGKDRSYLFDEIRTELLKSAQVDGLVTALKGAQFFINNGVALGYIKMPYTPEDPAWVVLPKIEKALHQFSATEI